LGLYELKNVFVSDIPSDPAALKIYLPYAGITLIRF
jgi:hypothetical protein